MRVLCEDKIQFRSVKTLTDNISKVADFGVIRDIANISKALNEFKPNLLILTEPNITPIVRAYADRNKAKIICFGDTDCQNADITIKRHEDIARANLNVSTFKEDIDKQDISVFLNNEGQRFIAEFLCKNYNVKVYGNVKINHPRYLGHITMVDKYDILNKSKFSIVFDADDAFDSILLGAYPIIYSDILLDHKTFTNMVSLTNCMEYVSDESNIDEIKNHMNTLNAEIKHNNSLTFSRGILQKLGFNKEAVELDNILKEQL